jgi:hypothetical protein
MDEQSIICPGCGVKIISENTALDKDFNAAYVCRHLCYKLSYYTLALHDSYFMHQLVVDTYAAQHAGKYVKPVAIAFGLVGLYLVNEKNYTGKQVQLIHMALAKKSKVWPSFSVPKRKPWLTVKDVVESPNDKKQEMIKKWSKSVWEVWKPEQEKVEALLRQYLYV